MRGVDLRHLGAYCAVILGIWCACSMMPLVAASFFVVAFILLE